MEEREPKFVIKLNGVEITKKDNTGNPFPYNYLPRKGDFINFKSFDESTWQRNHGKIYNLYVQRVIFDTREYYYNEFYEQIITIECGEVISEIPCVYNEP